MSRFFSTTFKSKQNTPPKEKIFSNDEISILNQKGINIYKLNQDIINNTPINELYKKHFGLEKLIDGGVVTLGGKKLHKSHKKKRSRKQRKSLKRRNKSHRKRR